MENILNLLKTNLGIITLLVVNLLFIVLYVINIAKLSKLRKSYVYFMRKLGEGNNIQEILEKHITKVEEVSKTNEEIIQYCKMLDNKMNNCLQKVGIVRYNDFRDTGSDLSFALALLDKENNGVVLNGIYARETSNIYAKPVKNGESKYRMTEEEKEAIKKAMNG